MRNPNNSKRLTVPCMLNRKSSKERIVMLTAYDYLTAKLLDQADVDIVLVGDSLGTVFQGNVNTLSVTLDEMIYHARCVVRAVGHALVVGDMPFMSYQESKEVALRSAGRFIKEAGVSAVKLEGGVHMRDTISALVDVDIPVMGHVGLTPQSFHRMGGHKIQGRRRGEGQNEANKFPAGSYERVLSDALAVEAAGAFALVVEGVPVGLAKEITETVKIPTIGIGAGKFCDGQVLVTEDLLGLFSGAKLKFVKRYANLAEVVSAAVSQYAGEVREGVFPDDDHSFSE